MLCPSINNPMILDRSRLYCEETTIYMNAELTHSLAIPKIHILLVSNTHLHGPSAYWLTADCNLALSSTLILLPPVLLFTAVLLPTCSLPLILTVVFDPHADSLAWLTGFVFVIGDPLTNRELRPTVSGSRWKCTCRVSASWGIGVLGLGTCVVRLTLGRLVGSVVGRRPLIRILLPATKNQAQTGSQVLGLGSSLSITKAEKSRKHLLWEDG